VKLEITKFNINLFAFFLYLSLLLGFSYGENLNYGAYYDWTNVYIQPIKDFSINFKETLLTYDKYGQRHSPVYLVFLSIFLDLGLSFKQIRIFHLHLSIPLIFIFYKCLKLKYDNINDNHLKLLSLIIFLSPTFRSLSIWPDSRLPGLIFFVLTIYFFLKFKKDKSNRYIWFTSISLIVSSYISPNFSFFFIYFLFSFVKKMKLKQILIFLIFNLFSAIPIFYYIFVLDVNFLTSGSTPGQSGEQMALNFNLSNKIMIISSIIFFHLLPVLLNNKFYKDFYHFLLKRKLILFLPILILTYFFDYQIIYTGGGIFFNLSNLLFGNNFLFFFISFFSISFLVFFSYKNLNNFYLLSILIISNLQNSIYHKYYEPLVLIMFFTLLQGVGEKNFLKDKINIFYLYVLSIIYILMRLFKIMFLV